MKYLVDAHYEKDYLVRIKFNDGYSGKVDLKDHLNGEIFEPLKDIGYFRKLTYNPEIMTVVWPNGADFAPEFLYELLQRRAVS